MIDLSNNLNPITKHDFSDIFNNNDLIYRYPCDNEYLLKNELALLHGVKPENITLGCGSSDIINRCIIALNSLANKKNLKLNLIVPIPTFDLILDGVKDLGLEIEYIKCGDFKLNVEKIKPKKNAINLIYITNPNNPSANELNQNELNYLISLCKDNTFMILDEAYAEFCDDFKSPKKAFYDNLIITRTFSKIYALAGLRIGYAIAKSEFLEIIDRFILLDNINAFALFCALNALKTTDIASIKNKIKANKMMITKAFDELNIKYYPSNTNFILHEIKDEKYADFMKKNGILVGRKIKNYPLFNRISVGTADECEAFCNCVKKARESNLI